MREAVIKAEHLSKRYASAGADDGIYAIRGVSLAIHAGEVTVLMGPSGSGKTTLLSMLGGLLAPTAGELNVAGTHLSRCDESRRQAFRRDNVGFVFQSFNLLTALTAEQNVALALKMRGFRQSGAAELLAQVGLSGKASSLPEHLSGGQRQRIAIARALAGNPPVLLADEPTASLDAEQGRVVMALMRRRAHENGTAVVVVTHDDRVRSFADRVIELQDGQLRRVVRRVRIQSPKNVYAREITHAGT